MRMRSIKIKRTQTLAILTCFVLLLGCTAREAEETDPIVVLIQELRHKDARTRESAVKALRGVSSDARVLPPLAACLTDNDSNVRRAAIESFVSITMESKTPAPLLTCFDVAQSEALAEFVSRLLERIVETEPVVSEWALDGRYPQPRPEDYLQFHYNAPSAASCRENPILLLGVNIRDFAAERAANLLSEIGEPAVDPLVACLHHPDPRVVEAAIQALGRIGRHASEPLIACLSNPDPMIRFSAARSLGFISRGEPAAFKGLVKCLSDATPDVRTAAAEALGRTEEAKRYNEDNVLDPDPLIRAGAIQAVSYWLKLSGPVLYYGRNTDIERIIHALGDPAPEVQQAAFDGIVGMGSYGEKALERAIENARETARLSLAQSPEREEGDEVPNAPAQRKDGNKRPVTLVESIEDAREREVAEFERLSRLDDSVAKKLKAELADIDKASETLMAELVGIWEEHDELVKAKNRGPEIEARLAALGARIKEGLEGLNQYDAQVAEQRAQIADLKARRKEAQIDAGPHVVQIKDALKALREKQQEWTEAAEKAAILREDPSIEFGRQERIRDKLELERALDTL